MENKAHLKEEIGSKEKGFFHHAYFVLGRSSEETIRKYLEEEFGIKEEGNPDFHVWKQERFYIEDAHLLQKMVSTHSFKEDIKKVFFVSVNDMTIEAQNSLLKTVEEPTPDTIFFFFFPSRENVLPTLLSRLVAVSVQEENDAFFNESFFKKFVALSAKERLESLAPIIEEKDKGQTLQFLNGLEKYFYKRMKIGESAGPLFFEEIRKARRYLRDTASSQKMILEHIVLLIR